MQRSYGISLSLLLGLLLFACSGPANIPETGGNRTLRYEPGAPNFDMEAVASVRDGQTGIDVYVGVPYASIIFVKREEQYIGRYEIDALVRAASGAQASLSETWSDTVLASTYEETQAHRVLHRAERIDLPAGEYELELAIEDVDSGARTVRRQEVDVFDVAGGAVALSDVRLEMQRGGEPFSPALSLHIPSGYDTLRAGIELYNVSDGAEAALTLVQYRADTSIAVPPYWFTPGPFSIPYIGIDYARADTLQTTRRLVRNAGDHVTIDFLLPPLETGNYAALVHVWAPGDQKPNRTGRFFSIKGETFPRITSLREMVEALTYIASENEMKELLSAESEEEMKRRFDAFWAARMPNRQAAAELLASYYSRVEEANLLFSNHKEGWKTDPGMIYIIFGAPDYQEETPLSVDWYYYEPGFPIQRRLPPFEFRRSTAYGLGGIFENFVLQRGQLLEGPWTRRVESWRKGRAL